MRTIGYCFCFGDRDSNMTAKSRFGLTGMRPLFTFLAMFALLANASSQSIIDSLRNRLDYAMHDTDRVILLNELGFELHPSKPRETVEYATQAIHLANKINYTKGLAKANNVKGVG